MLESPVRSKHPQSPPTKSPSSLWQRSNKKLAAVVLLCSLGSLGWIALSNPDRSRSQRQSEVSSLVELRSLAPATRADRLQSIVSAEASRNLSTIQGKDYYRARYLLAVDLIQQGNGKQALPYLRGLEDDYPLLQPQIIFQTARAYRQDGQDSAAQKTLSYLIKTYPQHPLTANALTLIEAEKPLQEAKIISQFPYHPLARKIAGDRLKQNPDNFDLLLLQAKYIRGEAANLWRDRLVLEYPAKLSSQDWETIADGYWEAEGPP